jgi:polar amino acid transport system substrate-binding protein
VNSNPIGRWGPILAAAIALALGCAGDKGPISQSGGPIGSGSPTLDRILFDGELRIGMSGDSPPMNVRGRDGQLFGMEVDLARGLAASMGVQPVFVEMPFRDLLPAVAEGDVDIVMSNVTMSTERNMRVAFIGPYFAGGKALLTKSATLAKIEEAKALDQPDLKLVALDGSTSEQMLRQSIARAQIISTETYDEAIKLVLRDEADAMIADFPFVSVTLLRNPDAGLEGVATPLTFEPIGAALPPGDPLFHNLVSNYIALMEGTGTTEKLREKWFSDGAWLSRLPPMKN